MSLFSSSDVWFPTLYSIILCARVGGRSDLIIPILIRGSLGILVKVLFVLFPGLVSELE